MASQVVGKARIGEYIPDTLPRIAILIPCFNEELTIVSVIESFRSELASSTIYVFDNNSTDRTVERARERARRSSMCTVKEKGSSCRVCFARSMRTFT